MISAGASVAVAESPTAARWLLSLVPSPDRSGRELVRGAEQSLHLCMQEAGPEPDSSVGAGTAVVFEGRLFDRGALASALALPRAASRSDAEIVRRAFVRWGADAIGRLEGEYALSFWDARSRSLFAARDRTGVYPLFFRHRAGSLHLSTSPSVVASAGGTAEVDRNVLAGLVAHVAPEIDETCYRGVRRIPAGHLLTLDASGLRSERYWRLAPIGGGASWMSAEEADTFPEVLDRVVGRAQDGGRSAIFLSGGLDSVSIAVAAASNARRRGLDDPLALSFFFPDRLREESVQRAVAQRLGLNQVHLEFAEAAGRKGMLAEALALSAELEAPLQNIWLPGYLKLAQAGVEQGSRSILTGRGGDEWLTMFPIVAADLIRSLEVRELFAHTTAAVWASSLGSFQAMRSVLWNNGARPLLSSCYGGILDRVANGASRSRRQFQHRKRTARRDWLLPDPALRRVIDRRAHQRVEEDLREPRLPVGGFRHAVIGGMFENSLFAPSFEESYEQSRLVGAMHHDIYWDPELIEFLYRVPPRLLSSGGKTKGLVRQELARLFPDLGFDRQKKLLARGFVNEVLLAEAGTVWREMGGAQALASLGVVEPNELNVHVQEVLSSKDTRRLGDVWLFLRLESWVRPRI